MSRIFISHSSANNAEAVALCDWLVKEGWKDDVFLDVDPQTGIAAGERWERRLNEAAGRCEAVLFLVTKAWIESRWCYKEFSLAHKLNKRLFGVLVEDLPVEDLPKDLTASWQLVRLSAGRDHIMFRVVLPITQEEAHVTFSAEGLRRLKQGLEKAGLGATYFAWPPESDPERAPYRGLAPLDSEDAGIFFGRDGPILDAIDRLRGLAEGASPRMMVIVGASGSGKSSFLRAGLLPRLARDDTRFLPLPIVRPERAALFGESGFLFALESALARAGLAKPRAELRKAVAGGFAAVAPLLSDLQNRSAATFSADGAMTKPTLTLAVDQAEELFQTEGQTDAQAFSALLRELTSSDDPSCIVIFTIRSDNYERLQTSPHFQDLRQHVFSLGPAPRGSYAELIKGPARRLDGTPRALAIDDKLVDAVLADIEAGGATDALPILAFTLERIYLEYHAGGRLELAQYEQLGRLKGSIEAAVEAALKAADADPTVPRDRQTRLALLRRGLIPWLAGIDPDTGAPRRRIARVSEIPEEARPLIRHFVEQRLLSTDIVGDPGEQTIEPAHEALLRQWGLLQGWLTEDFGLLSVMDGVKRAARDWAANAKDAAWLTHSTGRLEAAEHLLARPDLAANLEPTDRAYLDACRNKQAAARRSARRMQAMIYGLLVGVIVGLLGWINQARVLEDINWYLRMRPYMLAQIRPFVLSAAAEGALRPGSTFRECAKNCPQMIVLPPGRFEMGSPASEAGRTAMEGPQHAVVIGRMFAVSKYLVTFNDWDACASVGACPSIVTAVARGSRPVININFPEAQTYVAWLSSMTGAKYRLLTEAEWEYAARAGTTTPYYWGVAIGVGRANCSTCEGAEPPAWWESRKSTPVGSFPANPFGLYDMAGNVWEWVEDCDNNDYRGAPANGSAWTTGDCDRRIMRGGSWFNSSPFLRSASRYGADMTSRTLISGFRIARTLNR